MNILQIVILRANFSVFPFLFLHNDLQFLNRKEDLEISLLSFLLHFLVLYSFDLCLLLWYRVRVLSFQVFDFLVFLGIHALSQVVRDILLFFQFLVCLFCLFSYLSPKLITNHVLQRYSFLKFHLLEYLVFLGVKLLYDGILYPQ